MGDEQIESSPTKKHLGVLVDKRPDMEHLSRGVRKDWELGFSLEKKTLWGDLIKAFQYLKGPTKELKRDFLQGHVVIGKWFWL